MFESELCIFILSFFMVFSSVNRISYQDNCYVDFVFYLVFFHALLLGCRFQIEELNLTVAFSDDRIRRARQTESSLHETCTGAPPGGTSGRHCPSDVSAHCAAR